MCEIMTILAALAFTVFYFTCKRRGKNCEAAFTVMLMFWGAALMWGVDCVANKMAGEPFFDISREDTILGFIILAAGCAVYGVLTLKERFTTRA